MGVAGFQGSFPRVQATWRKNVTTPRTGFLERELESASPNLNGHSWRDRLQQALAVGLLHSLSGSRLCFVSSRLTLW